MYAYAVGRNTFELEILQIWFKYICVFSTSVYMIVHRAVLKTFWNLIVFSCYVWLSSCQCLPCVVVVSASSVMSVSLLSADGRQCVGHVRWLGCYVPQYSAADRGDCQGGHECQCHGWRPQHSGDASAGTVWHQGTEADLLASTLHSHGLSWYHFRFSS